jgi:BirA family biotin operon repressor/biotin-[acetyl-CoA-carboxylase] ligase
LAEEGFAGVEPLAMLAAYVRCLAGWLEHWREAGFAPIREAWLARAMGLGEPITVRLERQTLDGRFLDLDDDGALMLGTADGSRRIAAGEIFPVAA